MHSSTASLTLVNDLVNVSGVDRTVALENGQKIAKARPMTSSSEIVPSPSSSWWSRESAEAATVVAHHPQAALGTTFSNGSPGGVGWGTGSPSSSSGTPLTVIRCWASQHFTVSPPIPMTRLIVSSLPQPLKTTMSPRSAGAVQLVDEHPVVLEQGVLHGLRRDPEGLDDEGLEQQRHHRHRSTSRKSDSRKPALLPDDVFLPSSGSFSFSASGSTVIEVRLPP